MSIAQHIKSKITVNGKPVHIAIACGPIKPPSSNNTVRNVKTTRVECDEIWSFVYAKDKNVKTATAAPDCAGDVWTWTAIDADSKMILHYEVGGRSGDTAHEFMVDLASRLSNRVQLTTDGHKAYLNAVEGAFGGDIDYAMLVKQYVGAAGKQSHEKKYSPAECVGTGGWRIRYAVRYGMDCGLDRRKRTST